MLSQRCFEVYGEDKKDIEKALDKLITDGVIHHYTYYSMVGYNQIKLNNTNQTGLINSIDDGQTHIQKSSSCDNLIDTSFNNDNHYIMNLEKSIYETLKNETLKKRTNEGIK